MSIHTLTRLKAELNVAPQYEQLNVETSWKYEQLNNTYNKNSNTIYERQTQYSDPCC